MFKELLKYLLLIRVRTLKYLRYFCLGQTKSSLGDNSHGFEQSQFYCLITPKDCFFQAVGGK